MTVWLQVPEGAVPPPGERPAHLLRREFDLPAAPESAVLQVSALGIYEGHANGVRISDDVLTPGYTEYGQRVQVQEYSVTGLLREGPNALAFLVADGWYRGKVGIGQLVDNYGDHVALHVDLRISCADGSEVIIGTDGWKAGRSHIVAADLFDGQVEDRRLLDRAAYLPGFDDSGWATPDVVADGPALVRPVAPPVRRVEELVPVSVTQLAPGHHVVDLGQNINGWVRLTDLGPEGTRITLTHGEWRDPDTGDLTMENYLVNVPFLPETRVLQRDIVTSAGMAGDAFEPQFTTHGFQFVRVEGHPGPLTVDDVRGIVVHTDLRPIGGFSCSDDDLNRLHDAAVWSFRGNACDIPTDCPTRERSGWTGDWQLYAPTAAYIYDVDAFSRKWLADVILDQHPDGRIANITPIEPLGGFDGRIEYTNGGPGWGDVIVSAPLDLYRAYGTTDALEQCWDGAQKWVAYCERLAAEQRHPSRVERNPEPLDHERYLRDRGFAFGEWFEPNVPVDFLALRTGDQANHGTAYLVRSAEQMAQIADLLGKGADVSRRYRELAANARNAWQIECMTPDGLLVVDTQASYVRALHFDLLPADRRTAAVDRLVQLIREAGTHLGTGFLSTPYLLPVLADNGHLDLAYELLLQDTAPSWLAMIRAGATTIWELWDGVDAEGRPHDSLNHYSKGAVISFLHHYVAGLRPTSPGYRTFVVEPRPGGGLASASTWHESPHGRIAVSWRYEGTELVVDVQAPDECTWEVIA
jgi:alpha-L-rhamnosidase